MFVRTWCFFTPGSLDSSWPFSHVAAVAEIGQWEADFNTVNAEAQRHMDEKIELRKEIDEWKDNFERLCEENKALHKANLNNIHAANDNR